MQNDGRWILLHGKKERMKLIDITMTHENPIRFFSALPFERCKDCAFCFSPKNDSNTFICVEGMEIRFVEENAFFKGKTNS